MGRMLRCARWVAPAALLLAACAPVPSADQTVPDFDMRRQMVERQIRARGVEDEAVLAAMMRVPRHLFVPEDERDRAYEDTPLLIGQGQTISQPYIVGYMTEALEATADHRVLEIGTGSGYQAAVIGELGCEVYTIEIVEELADRSSALLAELGYTNVHTRHGDGYLGWPEAAPFDRIILTAAPLEIPQTLIDQLAPGGLLIAPVGGFLEQTMTIVRKTDAGVVTQETIPVRFVPMVGGRGTD
jgi:protein-L-isoaspartate(D-aspartate) O-methyltransferase